MFTSIKISHIDHHGDLCRPHDLKIHINIDVESDFLLEKTPSLCLDRVFRKNNATFEHFGQNLCFLQANRVISLQPKENIEKNVIFKKTE